MNKSNILSRREQESLKWASLGLSNKEAASVMGCAPYTVQSHWQAAKEKLNAKNITHAVVLALSHCEISPPLPHSG